MTTPFEPSSNSRPPEWYAIWTRSRCEQIVADELSGRGFRMFCPCAHAWTGRGRLRRRSPQPMFPGYVFIEHPMDRASHVEVLKARGVVRVLGDRWDRLAPIPRDEVSALERLVAAGTHVRAYCHLEAGDRVRIVEGPLRGLQGYFVRERPTRGLFLLSITLLRRTVAVEVNGAFVEAA